MKTLFHVLQFEWKTLKRSRSLGVLLWVFLGAGVYGIYFGKFEIDEQRIRIAEVEEFEKQQFDSLMLRTKLDTTISANTQKYNSATMPSRFGLKGPFVYYVSKDLHPLAGLCLGQIDLFPAYYGFHIQALAKQLGTNELANPMKLLAGNFDLSYVIVFLLPLVIVALFYTVYASEKESGTLFLLRSEPIALGMVLLGKGLPRVLVILGLVTFLLALGFVIHGVSLADHFGLFFRWLWIIYGYSLLWILFMGIIVWLRQGSALSAILGLGGWLIFTVIAPALLNLFVSAQEPLPNRAEMIHAVRNLNDKNWNTPKSFVFDRFYADHPALNQGDTTDFIKWYYASFTLLDKEANRLKGTFEAQVKQRNELLEKWKWLAPAAWVHEKLSRTCGTDRRGHMAFLQEVHAFHEDLKSLYYPKIFNEQRFTMEDLKKLEERITL